jgi:hypothetical protein
MPGPVVWNRRDTGGPAHPVRRGSSRPIGAGASNGERRPSRIYGLWQDVGRADPGPVHWPLWPAPFPPLFGGLGLAHADDAVPNTTAVAMAPATRRFFMSPPFCLARDEGRFEAASVDLPLFAPQSSRTVGHTAMGESASASRPRGDEGPRRSVTPQNAPRIAYDWTSTSSLEHTPKAGLPVPAPWLSSQP